MGNIHRLSRFCLFLLMTAVNPLMGGEEATPDLNPGSNSSLAPDLPPPPPHDREGQPSSSASDTTVPEDSSPMVDSPPKGGVIDIRQPDPTESPAAKSLKASSEPSWMNDVVDENAALWRENGDVLEIIPNGSGFGLTTLGFTSVWKSELTPGIWVVPRFSWTFAGGPKTPDVQAQLYDLRLEMNLAQPINDFWTVHLQLAPAFTSDWNNKSSDAFRLVGGGMVAAHVSDELTLLGGAQALSRFDIPVLPIGGLRWHPTAWIEVDALFPNPRIAWRHHQDESGNSWFYIGGQLGGNQWAIDHASNDHDRLGYRDYRIVFGWENRTVDGNRSLFEIGYVFDRELRFKNGFGDQSPGETFVIRWGSRF